MNNQEKKFFTTKTVVYLAVLATLLIVLNLLGTVFKVITNVNLTLIPIVLGALILGWRGGLILGIISGLMTFIFGVTAVDPFTNILFTQHPVLTFLTCVVKITVAGVVGGLLYSAVQKKNKYVAVFSASAIIPIINTALFIIGALLMSDTIGTMAQSNGVDIIYFLVILCAGVNFLIELAINLLVAPAIHTVVRILEKTAFKVK
ncbi:MAG: ECF transporter S component [Clostridia bacterium]|nr:ECF transporter S component [Clostridia bacterium]